ncbi:hypothetical protein F511_38252 [Dorcoceras hygrometricum]|uniref:Uncharacterized protein n=1 Tax=Dorcoceras hygrometricum TaxID=472368 RepID=A0A2Z7CYI9_9LAMI|nr:hypothetical protein F511_38252 [Dorcoceras hygrometricum]
MSDSYFDHRSFPNEYTIEFESSLCLRLKSFLSTDLSLKKTKEQFLTVERFCCGIHLQVSCFPVADVIRSVEAKRCRVEPLSKSIVARPRKEDRSRDDKILDDRYRRDDKKEDRYKREDRTEERVVERSKERSKDMRMRTRSDKRPSRKHDRKVFVAEESTKSWADTDSESLSSSSSSSDSEQEEVHYLMADQASDDENSLKLSDNGKAGIGFQRPENSKPSWLKNKLDKDKAKAGSKSFVPNQPRHNSRKAKSGWTKNQPRRDLSGQKMKSKLNRSHSNYAQTFMDPHTGKTVKVIQVWVPKGVVSCCLNQLWDAERPVVTASDTDEDVETMDVGAAGGDQQVQFSEEEPEDV